MRRFIRAAAAALVVAASYAAAAQEETRVVISTMAVGPDRHSVTRSVTVDREACREMPSTAGEDRTIVECVRSAGGEGGIRAFGLPAMETAERQFYVPGYRTGDGERHVYVLTYFFDNGVGNTNIYPDEYGLVRVSLPASMRGPGQEGAEPELLISSADVETGELRFSMDVADVEARAFVNALNNAMMNLQGDLAQLRGQPRRRASRGGPAMRNFQVLGERRISLAGENLSLDETLDLLYEVSGCSAFPEDGYLAVESCG